MAPGLFELFNLNTVFFNAWNKLPQAYMYSYTEKSYILILNRKKINLCKINNSNSAPEHATDMIDRLKNQQIEHQKTKIYTIQNFQFHFHCRVLSKNDTQKPQLCYCPDGLLIISSVPSKLSSQVRIPPVPFFILFSKHFFHCKLILKPDNQWLCRGGSRISKKEVLL